MTNIVAPAEMLSSLQQAKGRVEVTDANGNLVGHFSPLARQPPGAATPPGLDPEKRYTLKEVYQYLLSITVDEERQAILRRRLDEMTNE